MQSERTYLLQKDLHVTYNACLKACTNMSIYYGRVSILPLDVHEIIDILDSVKKLTVIGPDCKFSSKGLGCWKEDDEMFIQSNLAKVIQKNRKPMYTIPFWKYFIEAVIRYFKVKHKCHGKITFKQY